jgi:hypothetical protein
MSTGFLLTDNPLQEHHAAWFDMEQDMCNRFIHALSHILEQSPEDAGVMPVDTLKKFANTLKTLSEQNEEFPVLLHDGTEREIPRPVNANERQENYSGKKNGILLKMRLSAVQYSLSARLSAERCTTKK